jgi:hypothetical protein
VEEGLQVPLGYGIAGDEIAEFFAVCGTKTLQDGLVSGLSRFPEFSGYLVRVQGRNPPEL